MSTNIGFIGVGAMGGALTRRLASSGYRVRVHDIDQAAVHRCTRAGSSEASSAREAAKGAEVVFTSLPQPEQVRSMWRELAPVLSEDAIAVDVSTIDPATADQLGYELGSNPFVTCALGKTPAAAERGEIPLFVGGPAEAVQALRPVFDRVGEATYDFGSPGAAAMFKLISNMVGMTNLAVLAEGYVLARKAGIDAELFSAALRDTGACSFQSDVRLPWLIDGDYAPRFATGLAAKDVRLAVDAAARLGVPTPVSAQGLAVLVGAVANGHGEQDVIAVAKQVDPRGEVTGG